ncbi:energy transducer TonB, partial [Telmatospirillum siberiense]
DQAIEREVLEGMTLRQPPPKDMPMPIVVRMTARRPS